MSDVSDIKAELLVLKKENAELRKEFDKMDKWHSAELIAEMDENAKLREASRLMWQRLRWADEALGAVLDKRFERRMRELGVEVDA